MQRLEALQNLPANLLQLEDSELLRAEIRSAFTKAIEEEPFDSWLDANAFFAQRVFCRIDRMEEGTIASVDALRDRIFHTTRSAPTVTEVQQRNDKNPTLTRWINVAEINVPLPRNPVTRTRTVDVIVTGGLSSAEGIPGSLMVAAAKAGDLALMLYLEKQGVPLDQSDGEDSALLIASRQNDRAILSYLSLHQHIRMQAPEELRVYTEKLLRDHFFASHTDAEIQAIVRNMCEAGSIPPNVECWLPSIINEPISEDEDKRPIHLAAYHGRCAVIKLIHRLGGNLDLEARGFTPMGHALINSQEDAAITLFRLKASIGEIPLIEFCTKEKLGNLLRELLFDAIEMCDGARAIQMIEAGASIDHREDSDPLHAAIRGPERDMGPVVQKLLETRGGRENLDACFALHVAASVGSEVMGKILIGSGATVNLNRSSDGYTPMHVCAIEPNPQKQIGKFRFAQLLVYHGASYAPRGASGLNTPLHFAAQSGFAALVRKITEDRPLIENDPNAHGNTPLMLASAGHTRGHRACVKFLTPKPKRQPSTPLARVGKVAWSLLPSSPSARKKKLAETQQALVDEAFKIAQSGALTDQAKSWSKEIVSHEREDGLQPIHVAAKYGQVGMIPQFQSFEVDLNTMSSQGTPLAIAITYGQAAVVNYLLSQDVSVTNILPSDKETTALHLASGLESADVFNFVLEKFEDVNIVDWKGETPLRIAQLAGREEYAQKLNMRGATSDNDDIIEANADGLLPIHIAAMDPQSAAGSFDGMDEHLNSLSPQGTPLAIAIRSGNVQAVIALLAKEPKLTDILPEDHATTALHLAARQNDAAIFSALIKKFDDVDGRDHKNDTALLIAAIRGFTDHVRMLLQHGANKKLVGEDKRTAMVLAKKNGHIACAELIQTFDAKPKHPPSPAPH